jgi:hypothetical protein
MDARSPTEKRNDRVAKNYKNKMSSITQEKKTLAYALWKTVTTIMEKIFYISIKVSRSLT